MQLSKFKNYSAFETSLMTCEQGADFLGISLSAFWKKCRDGEIPHIRISTRCYRVRKADIEKYINERTR